MKRDTDFIQIGLCRIHPSAKIFSGAVIGKPFRRFLDGTYETPSLPTRIDASVYVGYYSVIGCESILKKDVIVDDHCLIESRVVVGESSLLTYRAQICNDAKVGRQCVIGGFIGERTDVGKMCRIFGQVIHSQHNPTLGWDDEDAMEDSPVIEDGAFIGFNASVIGPITIGRRAYVCAGAVVTRDVPALHVASCVNQIVPYSEWKGPLKCSPFFAMVK